MIQYPAEVIGLLRFFEKIILILTSILLLLALLIMPPFSKKLIAMGVMGVYSSACEKEALTSTEGIALSIPGGNASSDGDWFPFVMTFHPGRSFGYTVGKDLSLSILYNFGDFIPLKGCSSLYDPQSPYYSSFYGAYLVKSGDGSPYGFSVNGNNIIDSVNADEIAAVARYDYQNLVLRDFGLTVGNAVFDFEIKNGPDVCSYAGSDGWYRTDAEMTVNGCAHQKKEFAASYLQYGIPAFDAERDLAPVRMFGRIYGKFIEEKSVSVFFYIIAASEDVLETCDRQILSKSTVQLKTG